LASQRTRRLPCCPFASPPDFGEMARAMCMAVAFMLAAAVAQAEDGPFPMKDPSAMLTEIEGMVRSGETPAFDLISTIKDLIQDEIMPDLQTTQQAAAQDTTDFLVAIHLCNDQSMMRAGDIKSTEQVQVNSSRSDHAACREAEMALYHQNLTGSISFTQGQSFDSDSYCVKLGDFLDAAHALEIPGGSTRHGSVLYVKDNCDTNMCRGSAVTELDDGCRAQEAGLAAKSAECATKQGIFEREFCTWRIELESNCKELGTCHSKAVTAYNMHVTKRQTLVQKWNVEMAALQKILCYCKVWLSDKDEGDNRSAHNATAFQVCKNQTYTSDSVDYGTPPAQVPCDLTSVANYPGTSGFMTGEYTSFDSFVEPVVPCLNATSVAP